MKQKELAETLMMMGNVKGLFAPQSWYICLAL